MTRSRAVCAIVAFALAAVLALVGAPHGQPASASAPHRAAVVVDLGDGHVKVGCVSFTEDHISGLEALDRASMAPVAQTYGGQGSAVCALCGKGCSAGSTCLTCKAPNYWAYYHDGTYSSVGAAQAQVRDGDSEGWKWGKGERPAKVPFDQVCSVSAGPPPSTSPSTKPLAPVTPISPVTRGTPVAPTTRPSALVTTTTTATGTRRAATRNGVPDTATSTVPSGPGPATNGGAPTTTAPTTATPTTKAPTRSLAATTAPSSTTAVVPSNTTAPKSHAPPPAHRAAKKQSAAKEHGEASGRRHVVIERAGSSTRRAAVAGDQPGDDTGRSIVAFVGVIAVVAGLIVVFRRRRAGTA